MLKNTFLQCLELFFPFDMEKLFSKKMKALRPSHSASNEIVSKDERHLSERSKAELKIHGSISTERSVRILDDMRRRIASISVKVNG